MLVFKGATRRGDMLPATGIMMTATTMTTMTAANGNDGNNHITIALSTMRRERAGENIDGADDAATLPMTMASTKLGCY